jgi:hypothetical protein
METEAKQHLTRMVSGAFPMQVPEL